MQCKIGLILGSFKSSVNKLFIPEGEKIKNVSANSPVLQSARPRAVALASYTGVDKIIKSTVGLTRKDIWID